MRNSCPPPSLFFFLMLLAILLVVIQLEIITFIFEKLGLSEEGALLLLFASLSGSFINLPLFSITNEVSPPNARSRWYGLLGFKPVRDFSRTVIAVNVGGCVIPVAFSLFLVFRLELNLLEVLLTTGIVTVVSYLISRPVEGMGIGMPILVAPLTAAMAAMSVNSVESAPLAYIAGTVGVLIGADLLKLADIRSFNTPLASIGGAGTFDGIFVTGVVAVLLTQL